MIICTVTWTIEEISDAISIATPIILLIWFYYSQIQALSRNYFHEIDGIYAGFTEPISKIDDLKGVEAGIIMNIRETNDKGYFKGEFDFGETKSEFVGDQMVFRQLRDGVHSFIGKLDYEWYRSKSRHPLKPEENRTYVGKLYIIDRFDFSFEDYKIDSYLSVEYDILHYREMQTLKFMLTKVHRAGQPGLPETFTLYRKLGSSFEPYINIKQVVFLGKTRSDS